MKRIALAGNPNAGKTTLFNELTGSTQKIGNYPGVTVERKEGNCKYSKEIVFIDLPGTYSLSSVEKSEDERVARDVIIKNDTDAVLVVMDASNLDRQLFLASQVMDLKRPMAIVLTMVDVLDVMGKKVEVEKFEEILGIPVYTMVARKAKEVKAFAASLTAEHFKVPAKSFWTYPDLLQKSLEHIVEETGEDRSTVIRFLSGQRDAFSKEHNEKAQILLEGKYKNEFCDFRKQDILCRYKSIKELLGKVIVEKTEYEKTKKKTLEKDGTIFLDKIFLNKFWAPFFFVATMGFIFQAVFTWAEPGIGFVEAQIGALGGWVSPLISDPDLRSLLVDGLIVGVGNVLVFLPQIIILFFLLSLLEESGYLARAAYFMDDIFSKVGLSGRSFVPLLGSYACAVPGIMAARAVADKNERLATILISPMMTCSARLPIYTLIVAAIVPATPLFLGIDMRGVSFFALYFGAAVVAYVFAFIFRKTLLRGKSSQLYIELPRYQWPHLKNVFISVYTNAKAFVKKAGTVIVVFSILMWALGTYPKHPNPEAGGSEKLEYSLLGKAGKSMEPAFQVFGFDWKMGVSLAASFVAREVAVSTLATLYSLENDNEEAQTVSLTKILKTDPSWNILSALSYLAFFFFSMQCMSTLAVAKKETNSWRWPAFMFTYLTVTAFVVAWLIQVVGKNYI